MQSDTSQTAGSGQAECHLYQKILIIGFLEVRLSEAIKTKAVRLLLPEKRIYGG